MVHPGLVRQDDIIAPMTLSIEEVEHIAVLARLELSQSEKERFSVQLSAILDYAARLKKLDTSGILPTSSVLPHRSVLRSDLARPGLAPEELLRNAPLQAEEQFKVPLVLGSE